MFLSLVGLIAMAAAALVATPPVELVRTRVAAEVERQTGRKLLIGSAGVSFASGLGVSLTNVALSAPPAMAGPSLLTAERVEVTLALLPLFFREVQVDRLTLVKPLLELRIDREGRRSWDFASRAASPLRYAQAGGRILSDADRLPSELKDFARNSSGLVKPSRGGLDGPSFADVRIVDGRLRYEDARGGVLRDLRGIDASLSLPGIAGALSLKGQVQLAGEAIAIESRIEEFREFLADRSVGIRLRLAGKTVDASYDGKLAAGSQPLGEGRIAIRSSSAAALSRALGLPLSGLDGLGPVSLDGQLRAAASGVSLSAASFTVGATAGSGSFGIETHGERPRFVGNLRLAMLDLDQLSRIAVAVPQATDGTAGRFAAPAAAPRSTVPPRSIDELLERQDAAPTAPGKGAQVKGFRQRAGNQWEVETIDATVLRIADADARMQIAALKSGRIDARGIHAGVELKAGILRVSVTDAQLAGGAVRGLASIDARQPSMTVGVNLSGDGVAVKSLLDAAGVDVVEGRGRMIVAVSAHGQSERELVSTLSGRAEARITDGALTGWDADAIIAGLTRGQMPPAHRQPGAKTPFKMLSGTFQIAQGVARTADLKLDSPTVGATGTGTINIVDRNVDLLLKPRVATGGIEVPVRVAGHWDDPRVVADVAGALNSPQAQEAVRQLKDGNVEGALRSVLGNGPKADQQIGKAKEVLRGLLSR